MPQKPFKKNTKPIHKSVKRKAQPQKSKKHLKNLHLDAIKSQRDKIKKIVNRKSEDDMKERAKNG